ncbi:MAG: thioether cross-link-forming SCIFF peptide maturase [Dethiobacter sp.]|nr:thioether cross-link-forming SCIFF peptide maturase [Dethiobacter sp.]
MHRFSLKGRRLVLDVESNALHEFDQVAWQALELLEQGYAEAEINGRLALHFGEQAVAGALSEIHRLKQEGLLYSEARASGAGAPARVKALCLFIAESCNLICRYCFVQQNRKKPAKALMSAEVGSAAVDFLIAASGERRRCEIDFFGGEPLLNWPVLREITAYARKKSAARGKEFAFTLTTNGELLTPQLAACLEEEGFAAVLSLDGRSAVHDRMRLIPGGGGSYQRVLPRILSYTASDPRGGYYIRGTYTRFNLDFCRDVEHLYALGFRRLSLEPVVAAPDRDFALREEDLPCLEREYENLLDFYLDCRAAGDPFSFFHFNVDLDRGPCLPKRLSGCGAGQEYLAITADGSIYPCHQLAGREELKMGRLLGKNCGALSSPAAFIPPGPLKGRCRDCWARYHCGGGCRAASYLNGDPAEPYHLECALQRKRLECALYLHAVKEDAR